MDKINVDKINHQYLIKLLIIGDSGVGKSCILLRFVDDQFTPSFITTIGIDFKIKTIEIDGKQIKLQIWDTAGQERFRTITTAYYRGAMGIVLTYDVTDKKSFDNIKHWITNIEEHAQSVVDKVLVGNKCDCEPNLKVVTTEMLQNEAKKYGIDYFESSAKSNINIDNIFFTLAKRIKHRLIDTVVEPISNDPIIPLDGDKKNTKQCCK